MKPNEDSMPAEQHTCNVRAPNYAIASASATCANCGRETHVIALCVPAHHEVLTPSGESGESGEAWESIPIAAVVFQIDAISAPVAARIATLSPHFRRSSRSAEAGVGWVNHCEHCGSQQGEYDLHCEPEGAFGPADGGVPKRIVLLDIAEPFEASASGFSLDAGLG